MAWTDDSVPLTTTGVIRTYLEGDTLYVEAPLGANPTDLKAVFDRLAKDGYHPSGPDVDEETDYGLRVACHLLPTLRAQRIFHGLFSTPMLMGMGAIMASEAYWSPVARVMAV